MKVLVSGVAGLVGARLAEVLVEGGHRVLGFDRLDDEEFEEAQRARLVDLMGEERFTFEESDFLDQKNLDSLLKRFSPDAVVHLATRRDLFWADQHPLDCLRQHAEGAVRIMTACHDRGVAHLVFRSSHHVYGGSRRYPFVESDPVDRPLSMVGASLRAAELALFSLAHSSPVNVTVARLFCVYGPRQGAAGLVPSLMDAAERRTALPVFGDGTSGRDLVHVDDVVLGLLRMLDRPAPWRILNLASGQSTTLAQVAEQVAWLADVHYKLKTQASRPGDLPQSWADLAAVHAAVGYEPVVKLEDGLRQTWEWFVKRPDAFRA